MSRAFVKETDAESIEVLPDRPISPHPNFVTPAGLAAMERDLAALDDARAAAVRTSDAAEMARIDRELRYWTARRASAQLVPAPDHPQTVQFGVTVTLARGDGRRQTFRIVGEDEADPAHGTLSHVSPLARALFGKAVGDVVAVGGGEAEILGIG